MNKTLHKKLTGKHSPEHGLSVAYAKRDLLPAIFMHEMSILEEAAKDLLQPRAKAVADLLRMAKDM